MRIKGRIAGALLAGAALLSGGAAAAVTAAPASAATTHTTATVGCDDYNDGYCGSQQLKFGKFDLDVYQQKAAYGNKVILWTRSSSDPAQDFVAKNYNGINNDKTFEYAPNGVPSGLCVSFPSTAKASKAVLRTCNQSAYQTFEPVPMSGSYVAWKNLASGYVMEDGAYGNQGTQLDQWVFNGGDNQAWKFVSGLSNFTKAGQALAS
jgi:hypothetical protein